MPASRSAIILIATLTLPGCSTAASLVGLAPTTHDVERIGHGAFRVHTHIVGPSGNKDDAKADDSRAATAYCAKRGLPMTPIDDKSYGGVASDDMLTFRCGANK